MRRRFENKDRELEDFIIRFYPAGNYTWIVPDGCFSVDVFLVGGGSNQGGYPQGGVSDYTEGKGGDSVGNGVWAYGGGGYGGGAGGAGNTWQSGYQSPGGDGTVLIRGKKYKS